MYVTQQPWVELCESLYEFPTPDAYTDLLEPWLSRHAEQRHWLLEFSRRTDAQWTAATDEDLCRLYAAFRVASTLLLRFQHGRADGSDFPGPEISVDGYRLFFEALGFQAPDVPTFHPFFHEIVAVNQYPSPAAPITILHQRWPPLMLGSLMFCRAGCVVTGGADHVVKEIAQHSKLYWTFRRKDRPYNDLSHGWGNRSQWRTQFRRDYRAPHAFHYNVDATEPLDTAADPVDDLPLPAMRELLRHRCLIRTAVDDSELFPYLYSDADPA
jgi:hypothetical protein